MRATTVVALLTLFAPHGGALAQSTKAPPNRTQEDVAAHRQMARVHEAAARCLESGQSEKTCHEQLVRDCQGVGIGKHCGMRHKH